MVLRQKTVSKKGNALIEIALPSALVLLTSVVMITQNANSVADQFNHMFVNGVGTTTLAQSSPAIVAAQQAAQQITNTVIPTPAVETTVLPAEFLPSTPPVTEAVETAGTLGETQVALTVNQAISSIEALAKQPNLDPGLKDLLTQLALSGHQLSGNRTMGNLDDFSQKYNNYMNYFQRTQNNVTQTELYRVVDMNSHVIKMWGLTGNNPGESTPASNNICQAGGDVTQCVK
jgi:hypothetical protein